MARYIDADKFIERLKASPAFPNMGMDGYFLLDVVENLLKKFPTADVAPKSQVAREIKALENKVGVIYNRYVFEDTDYADDDVAVEAVMNALTEALNEIAELKKKYTKGGEKDE